MLILPRIKISADFLASALDRYGSDELTDRRLMLIELAYAAWGFVITRPSNKTGFAVPFSPFSGTAISQVIENHIEFEENLDDILTLQALQDSATAVLVGGVPPSVETCSEYLQEFIKIFRPYLRDHLNLGLLDVLPSYAIEALDNLPRKQARILEALPEEAINLITSRLDVGSASERILNAYKNFTDCIAYLARRHGLQEGLLKQTMAQLAVKRGATEGKISKEAKVIFIVRSRAQNAATELSLQDTDNYIRNIAKVLRLYGYSSPFDAHRTKTIENSKPVYPADRSP